MAEQLSRRIEEVFPGIKLNDGLQQVLKHAMVTRVTMNRRKRLLRVYLECSACLPKEKIYELERALTRGLQAGSSLQVRVIERFRLSSLYTPETLLEQYGESIELELRQYNHMLAWLYHTAEFEFPGKDRMRVAITDSVVAKDLEEEFYRILEKILNERCGLGVQIEIAREERQQTHAMKENELLMRAAANNVVARTAFASGRGESGNDAETSEAAGTVSGDAAAGGMIPAADSSSAGAKQN
ncbi:MAG: hypothetical protein IJ239_01525, partial [Eubacterium sp.]|nr:hypothetical protein [Eubacterium sp.]